MLSIVISVKQVYANIAQRGENMMHNLLIEIMSDIPARQTRKQEVNFMNITNI